jgi:hypothetical protein
MPSAWEIDLKHGGLSCYRAATEQEIIPNGYDYSATAAGRFYAARIHRVKSPYRAAVIMLLLEAGG